MEVKESGAQPIEEIENVFITMPDGARLAARIWRPAGACSRPVPAILEYIPYRKRFGTAERDAGMHPKIAAHGYACIRVDLRGSGESDGVLRDEYLQQELDDGCEVIAWLAAQPWCDGNVGMVGISWGGFNGLQIAAMQPPALRAVISVASTDDRYSDDVHHMGGCLLGDNLSWASTMFAYNSLPPDPALVGERWRDMWFERLQKSGLWLAEWLRHQRRDAYWKHGSICEDFSAVRVPVYAVSGWADGYSNAVFRLVSGLRSCKGLIGPWSHKYPHLGVPGPAIDFVSESLRWWDHWLKGQDTGIMEEPALRVWMQDSVPPSTKYAERPGRWVAESGWPSSHMEARRYRLSRHQLVPDDESVGEYQVPLSSPLTVGLFAGKWCSYAAGPDLAHDQRQEDGGALVFETRPLEEDVEICGAVTSDLVLSVDRPVALIALRLSDVLPDGRVTRVTYGLLNLTHRDGSEHPRPMEPGRRTTVSVRLNEVAYRFPRGHRLRLSVSTSYWPLAWPSPEQVSMTLVTGTSTLTIPVRAPKPEDATLRPFSPTRGAPPARIRQLGTGEHNWRVIHDLGADRATLEVINDAGAFLIEDIDLEVRTKALEWYSSVEEDVTTARGEVIWERELSRGDWRIRTVTRTVLTATSTHFRVVASLDAYEGEVRVFSHNWDEKIERDLV
ncbi:MAG: CocE/NonD family hydrolase [Pseudohongiellaceae bacterium]